MLPGHAPLISTVRPGVLEVFQGSKAEQRFLVAGGIAEVTPERCTVLADEAMPFDSVTADQLADREKKAQEELSDAATDAEKAAAAKPALYASRFNTMFSIGMLYCMVAQQNMPV